MSISKELKLSQVGLPGYLSAKLKWFPLHGSIRNAQGDRQGAGEVRKGAGVCWLCGSAEVVVVSSPHTQASTSAGSDSMLSYLHFEGMEPHFDLS